MRPKHNADSPVHISRARGARRAFTYAVLIHLLLFALLFYGMHWQNSPSTGTEVELWSDIPNITPEVMSSRLHRPAPPLPPKTLPPQPDAADIALAQAKRLKQKKQQEIQQAQRLVQQQAHAHQQEQLRIKQEKAAQKKALEAQREQQRAEQQKQEQQKIEQQKATQAKQAAQQAKVKAQAEQQRLARLTALQGIAGKSTATHAGAATSSHSGAGGQGSPGYADKVQQRVKPNLVFDAAALDGNPQTVVLVQCAPDGTILSAQISRASGHPAWDDAVLRAVQKSDPMPRDTNGRAPNRFTITFRPKN